MNHCIAKIVEIIERGRDGRRDVLQLGYNLGRLSELSGLGREPFWDRWKEPVAAWDLPALRVLASDLQSSMSHPSTNTTPQEPCRPADPPGLRGSRPDRIPDLPHPPARTVVGPKASSSPPTADDP